jgi:hypothetical protein
MAFDFDLELQTAVKAYESRYGARDSRFRFLPVSFHSFPTPKRLWTTLNLACVADVLPLLFDPTNIEISEASSM